jgi:hypothetical protein
MNPHAQSVAGRTDPARPARHSTRPDDWAERAKAWVERSCAEQGVPVKISDPLVLAEIAEILCSGRDKRGSGKR